MQVRTISISHDIENFYSKVLNLDNLHQHNGLESGPVSKSAIGGDALRDIISLRVLFVTQVQILHQSFITVTEYKHFFNKN